MGRIRKKKFKNLLSMRLEEKGSPYPGLFIRVELWESKMVTSVEFYGPYSNYKRCVQDMNFSAGRAKWK